MAKYKTKTIPILVKYPLWLTIELSAFVPLLVTLLLRILRRRGEDYDEENNWKRPPSSYGSMRSESECEEEKQGEGDGNKNAAAMLPGSTANEQTRYCLFGVFFGKHQNEKSKT